MRHGANAKAVVAIKTDTLHHTAACLESAGGLTYGLLGLEIHRAPGIEKYNLQLTTILLHESKDHYVMKSIKYNENRLWNDNNQQHHDHTTTNTTFLETNTACQSTRHHQTHTLHHPL